MPGTLSIAMLAERVRGLGGWRRRAAAVLAGGTSVLALAPFFAWPILWLTLPTLVWLIDGAVQRGEPSISARWYTRPAAAAAEIGWWFGFGYFLAGLYWIGAAFLVQAEVFAVLMPFAVLLMPAGLALFYAAATALAAPFWRTGVYRVLALALSLSAMEWLRGHVLSGFPWNVLGYALTYPVSLMQSAAVFGIYGLTLIAILIFALPPVLWSEAPGRRALRHAAVGIAVLPLFLGSVAGHLRLAFATSAVVPGVKIRIVQPSVPQRDKWRPEHQRRIFFDHLDLSRHDANGTLDDLAGITHVVWPEAAMPFLPLDTPEAMTAIGELLPEGTVLITGALRAEPAPPESPRLRTFFNSMLVLGRGGLLTRYDKIHLVPFGEFLPLRSVLAAIGLRQLTYAIGSFDFGVTPRPVLDIPGLPPTLPLICYEAIFPGTIVQGSERPGLLVNITNDGWFGNTTGPRQHLHQARVRAVEEGIPLIRAANNGVSGAFDGYGRSLGRIDLDVRGVIDVPLPPVLHPPLYARTGDLIFFTIWLLGGVILGRVVRR